MNECNLPLQLTIPLPAEEVRPHGRNSLGAFGTTRTLRLGEEDLELIRAAARMVGLNTSTFIRAATLNVVRAMLEHSNADASESTQRIPPG